MTTEELQARIAAQAVQITLLHTRLRTARLVIQEDIEPTAPQNAELWLQFLRATLVEVDAALAVSEPECAELLQLANEAADFLAGYRVEDEVGQKLRALLNRLEGKS